MKIFTLFLLALLLACQAPSTESTTSDVAKTAIWPDAWLGHWEGVVTLSFADNDRKREVNMSLDIADTDTAGQWSWTITYRDSSLNDVRPYTLIAQDSTYRHFILDENNSILLDQYLIGNHMMSRFAVDNTLLLASYYLEGNQLINEIVTGPMDDPRMSGETLPDSINVENVRSYPLKVLQRAVLKKF